LLVCAPKAFYTGKLLIRIGNGVVDAWVVPELTQRVDALTPLSMGAVVPKIETPEAHASQQTSIIVAPSNWFYNSNLEQHPEIIFDAITSPSQDASTMQFQRIRLDVHTIENEVGDALECGLRITLRPIVSFSTQMAATLQPRPPSTHRVHSFLDFRSSPSAFFMDNRGKYFIPQYILPEEARGDGAEFLHAEESKTYLLGLNMVHNVCKASGRITWLARPNPLTYRVLPDSYAIFISSYL